MQIPSWASTGFWDLEVYDYSINQWLTLPNAFEVYPEIQISSVWPQSITEGETTALTIYHNGINTNNVYLSQNGNNLYADSWTSSSSAEISAIFSPSIGVNTGSWDLVVEDYQFGDIILPNAITINASPPIINFLTPTVASPGESLPVTISGYNTSFTGYSGTNASFYFQSYSNTIYPDFTNVLTDDIILGNISIPNNTSWIGSYDLIVNDPVYGTITLNNALNINEYTNYTVSSNYCDMGDFSITDASGNVILNNPWNDYCHGTWNITLQNNECYNISLNAENINLQISDDNTGQTVFNEYYSYMGLHDVG